MSNFEQTRNMHKKNYKKHGLEINSGSVLTACIIILAFVIFSIINYNTIYHTIAEIRDYMLLVFEKPMLLTMLICLISTIVISFSPLGKIKIGGESAKPEFKRFAWYSMLFGAGMGIGFMFWGVAEPLFHNNVTPIFTSNNNIYSSLATTLFHWGLFPWSLYALVSLALAFYAFNMDLPLAPRSLFYPLFKNKIYGLLGDVIDGVAVVVTLLSLASSLGFGALQVNAGFNYLFGVPISVFVQSIIIIVVTFLATLSVVSGVNKGVKILSELNMLLALLIAGLFLILGNSFSIVSNTIHALLLYLKDIIAVNFQIVASAQSLDAAAGYNWATTWTLFYWAWWIGWSIFVGMFIAKISKGRSVRDFLLSVTIIPSIIALIWFSIFGTVAIDTNALVDNQLFSIVSQDESLSLYALINFLDINMIMKIILDVISIVLIISFFVTSSDSGSLVVDGLTSGGAMKTPLKQKVFWTSLQAFLAIGILVIGGSNALDIIQMILIITASPFSIVIVMIIMLLVYQLIRYKKDLKKGSYDKAIK